MSVRNSLSRRDFLKIAAVGAGGALLASCSNALDYPIVTAAPGSIPTLPTGSVADKILYNGKILTVDGRNSVAQALAISREQILQVGEDAEILALAQPGTQKIDLSGRVVTPGMIDTHFHFLYYGQQFGYFHTFLPPQVSNKQELLEALAELAAQTPADEWIQGYFMFSDLPTRYDLDSVTPDHPVWVFFMAGHVGMANSRALEIAGLADSAPEVIGGIIEVDDSGKPTGIFYNHPAMNVLRAFLPPYTGEMATVNFPQTQQLMASTGVTSFHDNNVYDFGLLRAYQQFSAAGENTLRASIYAVVEKQEDVDYVLQIPHYEDQLTRFAGFKFLIDGQLPTAYCHEPHNGVSWNTPTWNPEAYKLAVRKFHDTGLQICTHCVGDAAVDLALDAYEAAMNATPRLDARHRIEHAIITKPESTQRMKDLGIALSVQPQFIFWAGSSYAGYFGEERAGRVIVTREWMEAGIPVAISSDAPSMPRYTPQFTLAGATSRLTNENKKYHTEQCLTFEEALRAHTMNAAYIGHEESLKGSLETGKLADLTIWSEDPRKMNTRELAAATIDLTMVGGKTIFEKQ